MDAGTNALDILNGRVYPLKLGFIGVVNRSQQDIISGKAMDSALDDEAEFFRTHPAYRNIAHRCGTRYLAKTLNQVGPNLYSAKTALKSSAGPYVPYQRQAPRYEGSPKYFDGPDTAGAQRIWR